MQLLFITMPSEPITNLRNFTVSVLNLHFDNFTYNPCFRSLSSTSVTCHQCTFGSLEYIKISSMYVMQVTSARPANALLMYAWKVAGALANSNGMTIYSKWLYRMW